MNKHDVFLRTDLSKFESTRQTTGVIYFELDGNAFPDRTWSDFPCVILSWWLSELRSIADHRFVLSFMDGPFRLVGSLSGSDATCVLESGRGVDAVWRVSFDQLFNQVLSTAKNVVDFCLSNGFQCEELRGELEATLSDLE